MKVAHLSDLHLLDLSDVSPLRFLNKRVSGYFNLRIRRKSVHRVDYVRAMGDHLDRLEIDHVIVTGDITNLALESEFAYARNVIERELRLTPERLTIVPGNHDAYTRGAYRSGRFASYFGDYLVSALPELSTHLPMGPFPVVKFCGPLAIVGLSTAVPHLPFVAAGELGRGQIASVEKIVSHPDVRLRSMIVALHHPVEAPPSLVKAWLEGLRDRDALLSALALQPRALIVHGHLHRRLTRPLDGRFTHHGATSASLHHHDETRHAAFNVYTFSKEGKFLSEWSEVLEPDQKTFRRAAVPESGWL
jgi:3',5'-cyclic AMP phosphodiesterase CpdA